MLRILLIAILLPLVATSQETKYIENKNAMDGYIERFYALKADTNVKHGKYKMLNFFGMEPIKTGYYKKGKMDSTWKEYTIFGDIHLQAEGNYKNDKKTGLWTFYSKRSEVEQKYDFTKKKLVYARPDGLKYRIINGKDTTKPITPDRQPVFIGGTMAFKSYIFTHLSYPADALKKGIHGMVEVAFVVDKNGHIGKVWINKGVEKSLNDVSINVIKQMPDTWLPAQWKGKPVSAIYMHEIPFILQ